MRTDFIKGIWTDEINVRDFIQKNYTPYTGDDKFLSSPTKRTKKIWRKCQNLLTKEQEKGGVLDVELNKFSGINSFAPGYIDKKNEVIVGLQTDKPLKRMINPYGGMRMAEQSLKAYGYELNQKMKDTFLEYRKTHNDGVFDAYPEEVRKARHAGLLTGLPDTYGRGRIIGDYRRIALYGIDRLIEEKQKDLKKLIQVMNEKTIRQREEISMQIKALQEIQKMALSYGIDISKPAVSAQDAVQAVYFGYLAGAKENNGAATSFGRTSTFLDIYIQRDLNCGYITEPEAQELIDQLVIKLRLIRHLRTPEYDELFGGDPTWVTESIGGMGLDGRPLVTKNSFRFLHTLYNLGTAPEPNLTVLWDENLPINFQKYCAKMSLKTNAIQYENDVIMRPLYGDDYAIACCVSAMKVGKQMQFFGARCNLAKALLYAINEGKDEITGEVIVPDIPKIQIEPLSYIEVWDNYKKVLKYVADMYIKANNIIHYMHDKYAYEASQMALHDTDVERLMAFGVSGFSVVIDSLSAIKHAKVLPIRNEQGISTNFVTNHQNYPTYGNDDDKADVIGIEVVKTFLRELREHELYRNAKHTLSILTITSNVAYGKKTGATPDGRGKGQPFAPGANPMGGREENGALAALNSVAKIPYKICRDGISNTFTIIPQALGNTLTERINNLLAILNGYFAQGAHHINVNILNRMILSDALLHPDKYPTLTIRVSGYAVLFNKLSYEQRLEVISRTFHERI